MIMIKIRYLDESSPRFKCGAEIGAAAVGGALGVGSSLLQSDSSARIARSQIAAQRAENQLNRDWQTQQAEIARQFNTSERVASQDWQAEMMRFQNEYNSPVNQAARLRAAGLNPSLAMGSNGVTTVSSSPGSSSPASSPMPSGVSGLSPVSQQPFSLDVGALSQGLGAALKSLSEAKKLGIEMPYVEQSLELAINNATEDLTSKQLINDWQRMSNWVKYNIKDTEVKKAFAEAQKEGYEALVSKATIGKVENEAALSASAAELNRALTKLHGTQEQLLALDVLNYYPKLQAYLGLTSAQTSQARAEAKRSAEEGRLASIKADWQEMDNKLRKDHDVFYASSYIKRLRADGMLSDADYAEAKKRLENIDITRPNETAKQIDAWLDYIRDKMPPLFFKYAPVSKTFNKY